MGDFVPSSPSVLLTQWRPRSSRSKVIDTAGKGVAMQFRPGAVTVSHVHAYLASVTPSPGPTLGLEIVSAVLPTNPTVLQTAPATDVLTAGWTRSNGGIPFWDNVNGWFDFSAFLSAPASTAPVLFRGAAAALASKRIRYIMVEAQWYVSGGAVTTSPTSVSTVLRLGGVDYFGATVAGVSLDTDSLEPTLSTQWDVDPSTGLPWTMAQVNTLLAAGANSFGFRAVTQTINPALLYGIRLTVAYADENRLGFGYFAGSGVSAGWRKYDISDAVLSANTWYYLVAWQPPLSSGAAGGSFTVPLLKMPDVVAAASASATTGEHRLAYDLTVVSGIPTISTVVAGEMMPALFDSAGTIRSQSNPYAELDTVAVYSGAPAAQLGQEVTTTGTPPSYGVVKLTVGWQGSQRPNQPLLVKLRQTSFTGTVLATATLNPADTLNGQLQDVTLVFDTAVTPSASTKHFLTVESAASSGRGWQVALLDQRSDVLTTTTAAEVQGAGFGGTTDAASPASSTRDQRYDLAISLVSVPSAVSGFSATPAIAV